MKLKEQVRNNSLAVISLVVAFCALGYNTWRNELSEENRTVRQAGFEILMHIATLQRITYLAHYDKNVVDGNPRKGWTEVLVLCDLAELVSADVTAKADALRDTWGNNWSALGGNDNASVNAIDDDIDAMRREVLDELAMLD